MPYMTTAETAWGESLGLPADFDQRVLPHDRTGPALASEGGAFPVVLFSHGLDGVVHLYASLIEDLVTHGYVVVAIDHTYDAAVVTMLDGGTAYANTSWQPSDTADASTMWDTYDQHIETWVADARFVLDQVTTWQSADPQGLVTGRLDLDRVGMFGHSYGGATAAQCCALDARFKAGINLEGTLFSPGEPTSAPPSRSPSCCS